MDSLPYRVYESLKFDNCTLIYRLTFAVSNLKMQLCSHIQFLPNNTILYFKWANKLQLNLIEIATR